MRGPTIEITSLSLSLGRRRVLSDVSLTVAPGESLGLIGPNGAGKTSLVGCLLGLLRPQSGTVRIDGDAPTSRAVQRRLGHVPERSSLDRSSTPRAALGLHHALAGREAGRRREEVEALLERVGIASAADASVRTLSKGMLQRLAFGVALVGRPSLIVLDEPFSGVDPAGVVVLRGLIEEQRSAGATLFLNSHRIDQVARLCDRVALMSEGRLSASACTAPSDEALERLVLEAAAGCAS